MDAVTSHLPPCLLPLSFIFSILWACQPCRRGSARANQRQQGMSNNQQDDSGRGDDKPTNSETRSPPPPPVAPQSPFFGCCPSVLVVGATLLCGGLCCAYSRGWNVAPFPANAPRGAGAGLPPFLPPEGDPDRDAVRAELLRSAAAPDGSGDWGGADVADGLKSLEWQPRNDGYALVTGASRGIGRAIAVELARRYPLKPLLLTSRNRGDLEALASDLRECYGAANVTSIPSDLSKPGGARKLHQDTTSRGIRVDVLVLNAGMGLTGNHVDLHPERDLAPMLTLNVESATVLANLYGSDMAERYGIDARGGGPNGGVGGGRILIVSSVTGAVPGVPGAAAYAATKSYLRSLSWGLAAELEPRGVAVTCALPGATRTDFARTGGMDDAVVWRYPLSVSTADGVAGGIVDAVVRGTDVETFPGRVLFMVLLRVVAPLVPPRILTWFTAFSWREWPFEYPPGWKTRKGARSDGGGHGDGAAEKDEEL